MVLRKQPPPRLENLHKGNARTGLRSSISPSTTSPHNRRLNKLPSDESIYSPDLNTSPAFDLMPLEEAQRSPMGSPTTNPPSSLPDGLENRNSARSNPENYTGGTMHSPHGVPAALMRELPDTPNQNTRDEEIPVQLRSNNPFLKPNRKPVPAYESSEPCEWNDRHSHATTNSEPLSQTDGYIPMTARLSLLDQQEQDHSHWTEKGDGTSSPNLAVDRMAPGSHDQSPWGSQHSIKISAPQDVYMQGIPANPYAPTVLVQPSDPADDPYGLHPSHSHGRLGSDAGAHTPSAFSSATSATSHELIDLESPGHLGVDAGSQKAGSSVYSFEGPNMDAGKQQFGSQPTLDASPSRQSPRRDAQLQPVPLARAPLTPAEEAKQQEQRSETYSIRKINWQDQRGNLIKAPILVQNKNGPCPLLALINALVLRADPTVQPPIVKALQTREQISLGLLIEALFEELITRLGPEASLPDIEALSQFLTMLHTGMNVNPRLTLETIDALGTFLQTPDLQLYSTFGIPLIHGWLAMWSSPVHDAMTRVAQFHEDIQMLHFRRQEFEDRVMRGQTLSPDEEERMADIQTIQYFVDIENKTQLSPFGLTQLSTKLAPGSVSIFFRNDHFSTLYKHPQSHQLYTLITDVGYANHAEVVWESLVDVTGFNTEFLSGDFRPVGNSEAQSNGPAGPRTSSAPPGTTLAPAEESQGRLSPQEQADADYAYALSLQFQEEEQREARDTQDGQAEGQNQNETQTQTQTQAQNNRRASAARTFSERNPRLSSSPRMSSPPRRTSSSANTLGIRPARQPHHEPDPNDPDAPPPPYEQAARRPQYRPSERPSTFTEFPSEYSASQYPGRNQRSNRYSNPIIRPEGQYNSNSRNRDRDRDCIMM